MSTEAHSAKIDWRTGKPMVAYDDAFWQGHGRRRIEQGLSIRQYCSTHGLALSTFRHRVSGRKRSSAARSTSGATASSPPFVEVTRSHLMPASAIEVVLQGLTLRLTGEPAQQVLSRVLERLA
ncbi:MAG: IS66 family insertion sequence element accessory protein TnpA [Roseateles sp.]|uniref:IS66 family insertion sequence element accessory protein TnpA n=1 Tax=Roseateles sp. TaxID=1971397 RepID=UPI0040356865